MDKKLDKRSANGSNYAGWAYHFAVRGHDTRVLQKMGKKGALESARMRRIRGQAKITEAMREEAALREIFDAFNSGFKSVEEYKGH